MNWPTLRPWLATVSRLVVGVVFLIAGLDKLHDPRAFVRAVRAYDATPEWLSKAIGYGLPVLELGVALLLILGVITRIAAIAAGSLLVVFLIGIVQAGARGIKLQCGCFGGGGDTASHTSYLLDTARDLGLLALAVVVVLWSTTRLSVDEYLARNDGVEMPSAKRMRTDHGARKYHQAVELKARQATLRQRYLVSALVPLIVLVSVIGIGVQANRAKISGDVVASHATASAGVVLGPKASKVKVVLYEDFQCPVCQQFQQAAGSYIDSLIAGNKAEVQFHMVSFLDGSSDGNKYSSRAANAAMCASDISVNAFLRYHDYLYLSSVQPKEGSNGRTNAQLVGYAQSAFKAAGTQLATYQACVQNNTHAALVEATTETWSKRGYDGTPTVVVNGKQVTTLTLAALQAAVNAAQKA